METHDNINQLDARAPCTVKVLDGPFAETKEFAGASFQPPPASRQAGPCSPIAPSAASIAASKRFGASTR